VRHDAVPVIADARLPRAFFERPVLEVARDLLGCTFTFNGVGGRLVEVEAYRSDDPASHSYRGRTARNAVMFGPPGRLYVYFSMGLHFCVNVVCEGEGHAAAVLLRALEPAAGLDLMRRRRGLNDPRQLCSGPAKLTQALAITRDDNGRVACGADRAAGPCFLARDGVAAADPAGWSRRAPRIVTTPRVGISVGVATPWRFVDADSGFLSRPLPRGARP
jgi:DNA-3-methyladenine glycosylase